MQAWLSTLDEDAREYFEERAAIAQFEGGLSQSNAEKLAQILTKRYVQKRLLSEGDDRK